MKNIIGLKELRENKISLVIGERIWEEVADFTKIKKGGIDIKELLKRL